MINEENFRITLSKNITNYRKINNLTQSELAEKLNYSDKAISKWERGESLPDIYTLELLAELYGVTINDLCYEENTKNNKPKKIKTKSSNIFISLLSVGLVWTIATLCFVILLMIYPGQGIPFWKSFIVAIPVSFIVLVIFSVLWFSDYLQCIMISLLVWSLALCFDQIFTFTYSTYIFLIAVPVQILVIIWYVMVIYKRKKKKSTIK